MTTPADPFAILRTKKYVALLVPAAVLGVVISFLVYWYLKLIAGIQAWVFTGLPKDLGLGGEPAWWPLLPLAVAGAIVGGDDQVPARPGRALTRGRFPARRRGAAGRAARHFPGGAGEPGPGRGDRAGGPGDCAGGGLAVLAVKLARHDVPASTGAIIAATGSFAALSTLLCTRCPERSCCWRPPGWAGRWPPSC